MLTSLSVRNYALIEELEISFPAGLSIITGETGAGKSILLGALGLVLGGRADSGVLHDRSKKCIIEVEFDIAELNVKSFFLKHELDPENKTVIRREITPEGKSRAFINDTPVTLSQLKELGELLVDIHSQHETLTLNDSSFQMSVVDAFASVTELSDKYRSLFLSRRELKRKHDDLLSREAEIRRDLDYLSFQLTELQAVKLETVRWSELEDELSTLNNSEEIKSALTFAASAISENDENLISALSAVKSQLNSISKYNNRVTEIVKRIESVLIEIKDISGEIDSVSEDTVYDPERISEISSVLDELYKLQKKHQVQTTEELIAIRDDYDSRVSGFSSLTDEISKTAAEIANIEKQLRTIAVKISALRKKAVPVIEKALVNDLFSLGMPNATVEVVLTSVEENEFLSNGQDRVVFLFSANKGAARKELNKVASGGELSRLMLSVKSQVAGRTSLPTVILDEIDTGVSGEVAARIGDMMNSMSSNMQVITITHLPQIASRGVAHFYVYKEDRDDRTVSAIRKLSGEERIKEIAKMLSSGNPGEAAIKNAKELLGV